MKKLILFGAGHYGRAAYSFFGRENIFCFCDNAVKAEEEKKIEEKKVISFASFQEIWREYIVIVCLKAEYCLEVCRQLEDNGIIDYVVYEALKDSGKTPDELIGQLQEEGERQKWQRGSYLYLWNKTMRQYKYLQNHVDITTLTPAAGELRKRQFRLLNQAELFFDFISELHIKPFLVFGNLIGAVRHRGFVPWDDDLDFGLIRNEYEKLLEFAYRKCAVLTYEAEDRVWVDTMGNIMKNDMVPVLFPDKYIFNLRPEMIQISKCSGAIHYYVMDIWAYDFYNMKYTIEDYKKWVEEINEEAKKKITRREKMLFIRNAREHNPMVSQEMTEHVFPGIDNYNGYPGEKGIENWILTKDLFPLRKVPYENTEFWAPHNMRAILHDTYFDYMEFPDDMGIMAHSGADAE